MSFQQALLWSIFWIGLSLLAAVGISIWVSPEAAGLFLTGYALEKALSVDNLFVFLMLFGYFKIRHHAQRKILNYGIIGVIVMRGLLIFLGIELVEQFEWLMYIFGAIVIYTGFVMAFGKDEEFDPQQSRILKVVRKMFTVTKELHGERFFIRQNGKLIFTPLFVVLIVVELTDLLFAVDSIPAIFSITRNPFLVFSSNLLAVLGLRSLYFLLERMHDAFRFVKKGVGLILWFVGIKMLLPFFGRDLEISNGVSLAVILSVLLLSIVASITIKQKPHRDPL